MKTILQQLATAIQALSNCQQSGNSDWEQRWNDTIDSIVDNMPSGSGIDNGTKIDLDACTSSKIVFDVGYHHMNDGGYYDGWSHHKIVCTPSFSGFDMRITGRDRNGIKDYLADVYYTALSAEYVEPVAA